MVGGGTRVKFVHILNRDKGWNKVNDEVLDLTPEQLARAQEDAYVGWVTSLAPLKDKALTLTALPERTVGDRPVLGLRVARKGRRDVILYFDKETALLLRSETRVTDADTNKEVRQTALYSDYKDVQGIQTPMKARTLHDGAPFMDLEILEMKYFEKVSDRLFARP